MLMKKDMMIEKEKLQETMIKNVIKSFLIGFMVGVWVVVICCKLSV